MPPIGLIVVSMTSKLLFMLIAATYNLISYGTWLGLSSFLSIVHERKCSITLAVIGLTPHALLSMLRIASAFVPADCGAVAVLTVLVWVSRLIWEPVA